MRFHFGSRTGVLWRVFVLALLLLQKSGAQLVQTIFSFPDYNPSFSTEQLKTFTTNLTLIPINSTITDLNREVFINSTTVFYSGQYNGFFSVELMSNTITTGGEIGVTYKVSYNYTEFSESSGAINDQGVLETIGNVSSVKTGLESYASFGELYNVTSDQTFFVLSANSLCSSASCNSEYVFCSESDLGLTPVCRSVCHSTFQCENDGNCVHRTSTLSPNCNCPSSTVRWFVGGRCEYRIEVWMIVIFILGFLSLILLIIMIGCICCRKRRKTPPKNKYKNTAELKGVKKKKSMPSAQENGSTARQPSTAASRSSQRPQGQQPSFFEAETDVIGPITSEAQVTMNESSSESFRNPRYYEETETQPPQVEEETVPYQTAMTAENAPPSTAPVSGGSRLESSSSSSSSSESPSPASTPGPPPIPERVGSPPESESESRRYNSLQFGAETTDNEMDPGYQRLDASNPWDKGTQTNTRINIILPDSILSHRL